MESIPSHSIILEDSETSKIEQPIDPRSPLTLDHHNLHMEDTLPVYEKGNGLDVVGDSSSYTITRGGRTIKPTQKVQDMGGQGLVEEFHRCSNPPGGLIHAVLNRLWGRELEKSAPVQSHIMESIPSHSIFWEDSEASKIEKPFDPRSPLTLDHHNFHTEDTPPVYGKCNGFDVVGDSSNYTITRGGRTIKPTQKVQDMGWTRASGRGKKGHRGRGNQNH
ncbi:hypothetical protein DY000_02057607 [Brassica cretica]|uniref:G-patch domain-containing protein n=1 Tax=Brassica cretica TaxID=69181 RepID=A0ABQ7AAM5_BRACR|nr:hypothetical protein DY000_02057607 [Brassica cretica]